jgi:hypothetical protein
MTDDHERCGVSWPVCPDDLGEGLYWTAGEVYCKRCGRRWPAEDVDPCPWPATVVLAAAADVAGETTRLVCASHAAHPSAELLVKVDEHGVS